MYFNDNIFVGLNLAICIFSCGNRATENFSPKETLGFFGNWNVDVCALPKVSFGRHIRDQQFLSLSSELLITAYYPSNLIPSKIKTGPPEEDY